MSDFVLTPAAQADLLRIIDFLEGDNPSAILKVVDALDEAINSSQTIRCSVTSGGIWQATMSASGLSSNT